MIQIFFIGSSSIYGVGGENGGYADIVKQALHKKMFGDGGIGEKYEIYNFGKSGATTDFVLDTYPELLKQYGRGGKVITVVNVGGNNAKAENEPDNFVSTIDEYSEQMTTLLDLLKRCSSRVIAVGSGYYEESKVNPKHSPLTGGKSYFSNERSGKFQQCFEKLCDDKGITFIDVGVSKEDWLEKYIYEDGLHANNTGHELISSKILKELKKELE